MHHNRVDQALENLISSMETGHDPQLLLYNQFLVRKMVTSVILHEILCRLQSPGCCPVLEELSIYFPLWSSMWTWLLVFMWFSLRMVFRAPIPRVTPADLMMGYRPVHMYGNLKTAFLENRIISKNPYISDIPKAKVCHKFLFCPSFW